MVEDVALSKETHDEESNNESIKFEDIIEDIGSYGKYQIRLTIIYCCLAQFFSAASSYATLLALTVPQHWCHVPGREDTKSTAEMWKNLTIPMEQGVYSSCEMKVPEKDNETTPCMYGWEYDDTWFSATAASQENWVCDRGMYPNAAYSISHIVSIVFGVLLFYIGDRFGRRMELLIGISLMAVFRSLLVFSSSVFPLYVALSALADSSGLPCAESAAAVGIELTGMQYRSLVNFVTHTSHTLGTIGIALAAWSLKDWNRFLLVTSVPMFIPLLLQTYLPESPRWLIGKGRPEAALLVLERVAAANGRPLPCDTWARLTHLSDERTPRMGIKSIVTNRKLLKNTILLVINRSAAFLVIYTLIFHNKSFGENPFTAYISQGVSMTVAFALSHLVGNRLGRRVSNCLTLLITAVICVILLMLKQVSPAEWVLVVGSLVIQCCCCCSVLLSNLQSIEIHPTCIRQKSIAIEYVAASCAMSASPYLSHLGNTFGLHYLFGVLACVMLLTSILVLFLPESLNEKLPETMKDASLYGRHQKFWSLPKRSFTLSKNVKLDKDDFSHLQAVPRFRDKKTYD